MDQFYFHTEHSPWFIPLCLAGGALYAYVLYSKEANWPPLVNKALAALRFLFASLLLFLLLGPFVRYISNEPKKPVVAVALDNSQSVKLFSDSVQLQNLLSRLDQFGEQLSGSDYRVELYTLDGATKKPVAQTEFKESATNLDAQLSSIRSDLEGENLAGVVLLSDGIVNQGKSPVYSTYPFPVYTVGLGDTAVQRDVVLASLLYNKVSYSGNRFPLVAELQQNGFAGKQVSVVLTEGGAEVERKQITLPSNGNPVRVDFTVTAGKPGKRHYVVQVQPLDGEFTELNNSKHAYVEVIEGKLNVLLAAAAPHPDIKAIKQALEAEDNIEVELYIAGVSSLKVKEYDMAILHQLPSALGSGADAIDLVKNRKLPVLYIIGLQTDLQAFNRLNAGVSVSQRGGSQTDQVTPAYSTNFSRFALADELQQQFRQFPPVDVPFAEYNLSPGMETILTQQVGTVSTGKPLLAVQSTGAEKKGVLIGDGIWEWRLREFANSESTAAFDKLFQNLTQLLTVKENKKKLNVYPIEDEFREAQPVQFEAEVYNQVYQKIYGQRITLTVTGENGTKRNYSFVNGENFSRFSVGNLPEGLYRYSASTEINGKTETDQGDFSVQSQQLEALNSQADHNLLYQLSKATGGRFYQATQLDSLQAQLQQATFKPVLYSTEQVREIVNLKWIFFLLLGLVSLEWFIRKYQGGY